MQSVPIRMSISSVALASIAARSFEMGENAVKIAAVEAALLDVPCSEQIPRAGPEVGELVREAVGARRADAEVGPAGALRDGIQSLRVSVRKDAS